MTATFSDFADVLGKTRTPEDTPLELQMLALFGGPGTGKSTIGAGFPNHMYLDLEASATELRINPLEIKTWARFKDWLRLVHASPGSPFDGKTLVIDTADKLWGLCVKHEFAERKISEWPDDFYRTRRSIQSKFLEVMQLLLDLRMQQRMGSVLICHENHKEIRTPVSVVTQFAPRVEDKSIAEWVAEAPQMVLRTSREDTNPETGKPLDQTVWVIRTKPLNASDVVKDRTNRLPKWVPADYASLAAAYAAGAKA